MKRAAALLAACILSAAPGYAADRAAAGRPHSLRMEELEVRGLREKPDSLYLPVHRGIVPPLPVSYDLFLVDMARPVPPREVPADAQPTGEPTEEGGPID